MAAEASDDKRIELPEGALPVFLRLLREKTIPWKSRFWPSKDLMLELNGAEFRMSPNDGMNPHATLKGTITSDGQMAVAQWRQKGIKELFWYTFLFFVPMVVVLLSSLFIGAILKIPLLICFLLIVIELGSFFPIRYKIIIDLEKMEKLLTSLAAEAAAEVGKAASVNRPGAG